MSLAKTSKREHCPRCPSTSMHNYVSIQPGRDVEIFVECAECQTFVARYTLKMYTGDDPYRAFLRLMRSRRMASGVATHNSARDFQAELEQGYQTAKEMARTGPIPKNLDDVLDETLPGDL